MNFKGPRSLLFRLSHPRLGMSDAIGLGLSASGMRRDPALLFTSGEQGCWYDPSDLNSVFADTAGMTPASIDGAVARINDKSGRGNHATQATAVCRPILRKAGGRYYLEFDGVDDFLLTGSIDFSTTDKIMSWAGVRKLADTPSFGTVFENNSGGQAVRLFAPGSGVGNGYFFSMSGGSTTSYNASVYNAPHTAVLSCFHDLAGAGRANELFPRVNGVIPDLSGTDAGTAGSGNFQNQAFYIGRRDGASLPFGGYLYGLILRGAATSALQIIEVERWLGAKTGVTLS